MKSETQVVYHINDVVSVTIKSGEEYPNTFNSKITEEDFAEVLEQSFLTQSRDYSVQDLEDLIIDLCTGKEVADIEEFASTTPDASKEMMELINKVIN